MSGAPPVIRIFLADHHAMFRKTLKQLLEKNHEFTVIGEAATAVEAFEASWRLRPDVLLLDVDRPTLSGVQTLKELEKLQAQIKIVLLVESMDADSIGEALHFGARGIVMKTAAFEVLVGSIRSVSSGHYWIGRDVLKDLSSAHLNVQGGLVLAGLTPRELEIVAELVAGSSNLTIAERLSISEQTVKRHLANIYAKAGVSNRVELTVMVLKGNSKAHQNRILDSGLNETNRTADRGFKTAQES